MLKRLSAALCIGFCILLLLSASDAIRAAQESYNVICVHSGDELRHTLRVAAAAADKAYLFYRFAVKLYFYLP